MQTVEQTGAAEASSYEKERGKPMPNLSHSLLEPRIAFAFHNQAGDRFLVAIELTLELADGSVLTPDVTVLAKRPINWSREPAHCRDLPILVVEIISPSQGYLSVVEKKEVYFANGVQSVWEVNPALRLIAILRPDEQVPQVIQHGEAKDPATGLTVRVEDVFA